MGKNGGLPWAEFTVAKAAKKSKLGDCELLRAAAASMLFAAAAASASDAASSPAQTPRSSWASGIWATCGRKGCRG